MRALEITPNTISEYIKLKQNQKLSNSSVNKHLALIGAVFQSAINEGLLNVNPVYKVKKLREPMKDMEIFNQEEIRAVLETTKKHYPDFYPLLHTAIFTGMPEVHQQGIEALNNFFIEKDKKEVIESNLLRVI
jgi:site-specific recombinase XerD